MAPGDDRGRARVRRHAGLIALAVLALCAALALRFGTDDMAAGGEDWILLPATNPAPAAPTGPAASSARGGDEAGRRFAQSLALAPRTPGVTDAGFVITAQSDAALLAQHQLRVGDVLLTMDGQPLDAARITQLGDELAAFDRVEVSFERGGQRRNRQLVLR